MYFYILQNIRGEYEHRTARSSKCNSICESSLKRLKYILLLAVFFSVTALFFQNCGKNYSKESGAVNEVNEAPVILASLDPNCQLTEEELVSANCELASRALVEASSLIKCSGFEFEIVTINSSLQELSHNQVRKILILKVNTAETCIARVRYSDGKSADLCIHEGLRNGRSDPAWQISQPIVSIHMVPAYLEESQAHDWKSCIAVDNSVEIPAHVNNL